MITTLWPYFGYVSEVFFVIMIVATAVVRMTTSKDDDAKVELVGSRIHRFISWFPTLGKNPRTKALEALYLKYKNEVDSQKSDEKEIQEQLKK